MHVCICIQGEGISDAKIYVNGNLVTTTSESGHFHLTNITTGTYHIQVKTCIIVVFMDCSLRKLVNEILPS